MNFSCSNEICSTVTYYSFFTLLELRKFVNDTKIRLKKDQRNARLNVIDFAKYASFHSTNFLFNPQRKKRHKSTIKKALKIGKFRGKVDRAIGKRTIREDAMENAVKNGETWIHGMRYFVPRIGISPVVFDRANIYSRS